MTNEVGPTSDSDQGMTAIDLLEVLVRRWKLLLITPLAVGLIALSASYLVAPTYTATTVLLPPQQAQSAAVAALASLGALAGAAGSATGTRNSADQYVALMQSVNVEDRIIDKFGLDELYRTEYRFQTRRALRELVKISTDRRSGLITISADDKDPKRAAAIANEYTEQLRRLTGELATAEAQQRRNFFEAQLARTRQRLTAAQAALQNSGFNKSVLRAEPRAAADGYAKLQAELTAAEVRLQTLRGFLTDQAPELRQQNDLVLSLRKQLARMEASGAIHQDESNYISKYREFKYEEALTELFSRQYEAARIDESREGPLVQVIDLATPPEYKTRPLRGVIAVTASALCFFVLALLVLGYHYWKLLADTSLSKTSGLNRLRLALKGH